MSKYSQTGNQITRAIKLIVEEAMKNNSLITTGVVTKIDSESEGEGHENKIYCRYSLSSTATTSTPTERAIMLFGMDVSVGDNVLIFVPNGIEANAFGIILPMIQTRYGYEKLKQRETD